MSAKNGAVFEVQATKEIILSAGFAGSPHILLLSGVGEKPHLTEVGIEVIKDLPGVGKNLHDHISFAVSFAINEPDLNTLNYISVLDYLRNSTGPLSARDLMITTAKIASPYSNGRTDTQFYFYSYMPGCSMTGIPGVLRSAGQKIIKFIPVALRTESKGYVKLKSADPFEHPNIVGNYLRESKDLYILLHGVQFALKLSKAKALEKYNITLAQEVPAGCEGLEYGSDDFWKCAVKAKFENDNHQMGTCKMGPASDRMAVVDARLRVHGIRGLRVMDASIMPRPITGNTHAPSMMIGEMGSKFIREDWEEGGVLLP